MAKTDKNVLGDQRGRIGKVVGRVVRGQQIYSAYAGSGKNPRTPKQVAHRARFALAVSIGKALKGVVNLGLRNVASTRRLQSPYNMFVHTNMPHISYDASTGQAEADYARLVVAEGDTPSVVFGEAVFTEAGKVTVPYTSREEPGAFDDDTVYLVVYAPEMGRSILGNGTRSGGTVTVELPSVWSGTTVHVWGFACTSVEEPTLIPEYGIRLKPLECSKSEYVGSGRVV